MGNYRKLCRYCEIAWPNEPDYATCPQCREPTIYTMVSSDQELVHANEVTHLVAHAKFGWWLWENERV